MKRARAKPVQRDAPPMKRSFPLATLALAAITVAAYAAELAAGGLAVCEALGLVPERFLRTGDVVPLFVGPFLHDPQGLAHVAGNVAVLLLTGFVVEGEFGGWRLLGLYVAAGVLGGLLHIGVDPSSSVPLVGGSGAIAALVAVVGVIRPRLIGFAVGFVAGNVALAWSGADGTVSFGAHLGGFAAGTLFAGASRPRGVEQAAVAS